MVFHQNFERKNVGGMTMMAYVAETQSPKGFDLFGEHLVLTGCV